MNKNDTLVKTLFVGISLCLVCSVIISSAAVGLRDQQKYLKQKDQQSKILSAAGLLTNQKSIEELFSAIEERVINLDTGEYEDSLDPKSFDGKKFEAEDYSRDPLTSIKLTTDVDISSLKRRENFKKIYIYKEENEMLKFKNFGRKSLTELQEKLGELNLHFGMDVKQYLETE